jgi:hypothetical protein
MAKDAPTSVQFHYTKSNHFRVVHGDGVWGGATPKGTIAITFFSERVPIPRVLKHSINPDGGLGEEMKEGRDSLEGVVREVEVTVVLDVSVAKSLIPWLYSHIQALEKGQSAKDEKE